MPVLVDNGPNPPAGHAGCLEIYTPSANETMQMRVTDATGTSVTSSYNSYFLATELQ